MTDTRWTPGPWTAEEYDEHGGYDCMTGSIRVGRAELDGFEYGQKWCEPISDEQLAQMKADAALIAVSPELYDAVLMLYTYCDHQPTLDAVNAVLKKARNE